MFDYITCNFFSAPDTAFCIKKLLPIYQYLKGRQEGETGTELTDALIRTSAADIVQATGVTVGGEFLGAVRDSALLQKTLEDLLNAHRQGNDQVAFTKEVELEQGLFLQ